MQKSILILFLLFSLFIKASAQSDDAVRQYINTYKELAIAEEIRTGVPAAITLAQGLLESDAGRSKLSQMSNNHFGIKCKTEWRGAVVYQDDDLRNECFRSYATVQDSYRDHSDFLKTRPNYSFLFSLDPSDCIGWANGLKKAGYATNPIYPKLLLKLINDNYLVEYTFLALDRIKNGQGYLVANKSVPPQDEPLQVNNDVQVPIEDFGGGSNYPSGTFTINHTKVIYAETGTSLFALANNYNISFSRLLEYNDLGNQDILPAAQLIYLEKKPKKSSKDYHTVATGETTQLIAQKEGVQLQSIMEYNKIQDGMQPVAGEKIYLHPGRPAYFPKLVKNSTK